MKSFVLFTTLFTFAIANPLPGPEGDIPIGKFCYCKPPICPLSLIAECKCKNNAAEACWKNWMEKGVNCPKPTPQPCGVIVRAPKPTSTTSTATVPTKPIPTDGPRCGGYAGFRCPRGMNCVDNPYDECDPEKGWADCFGICVQEKKFPCGGLAGFKCPDDGYECVDIATDECDPEAGGRDCMGVCVWAGDPGILA